MAFDVQKKLRSQKHVLIVDDDDLFRGALASTLKFEGYQVTSVQHAKIAKDIIGVDTIDILISDINMPGISGIQLLQYVKETKPTVPVILITGFAELKETKEAYEQGARGFLPKPFKKEELLRLIDDWLFPKPEGSAIVEDENQDLNYCKLCIDDFISGQEIKFDIYVRLSEKKYVKIAHQGENIPTERIDSYKTKNIRHLYMLKEDFKKYLDFNLTLLPLVSKAPSITKEKKRGFLKHTGEVILEHLYLNDVDDASFQSAKTVVESVAALLTEPDEMMKLLEMLNSHSDHLYAHSLGVSLYGVMIARAVNWQSPANIHKVAMGGLLHDIGKKEIPREILKKRRAEMTLEEVQLYETHPHRGSEILQEINSIPTDVLQVVHEHHENCLGLGFPMRLSRNYIHPMARLISVANEFCSLTIENGVGPVLSSNEAIKRMAETDSGKLDPIFFAALVSLFKNSATVKP